ncbi:2OG-Fe(II) oxygenase [Thalassobaculum sp.]|uniref:2OG-Fe(II) oxygenase n=1 Tax=Thalassobaculum sp. TaxID=2022740 RepID=UPI0032EDB11F
MSTAPFPKYRSGDFVPAFIADSPINPRFEFAAAAGRTVVLAFIGSATRGRSPAAIQALRSVEAALHRRGILIYFVTADPADRASPAIQSEDNRTLPFWDTDLAIHDLYGMVRRDGAAEDGRAKLHNGCFVIGRNLRLIDFLAFAPFDSFTQRLAGAIRRIPADPPMAPVGGHAPVLQIPDVFDRGLCRQLIAAYEADGGGPSGIMRDVNGITTGFMDNSVKRRRDAEIRDMGLLSRIRDHLHHRVASEIRKAFAFDASRVERFIVGCYDAGDRGFFRAHRDNGGPGTAHRRFAVSINLNAEEFEGGELWFPEYGPHLYKPKTGAAVVFSCSLLHEARPVTSGRRYAFLPFLFDDAAAKIRRENRALVSTAAPVHVGPTHGGPTHGGPIQVEPAMDGPAQAASPQELGSSAA